MCSLPLRYCELEDLTGPGHIGKRPLGRPRRRWEENIKMNLQEVGCRGVEWIKLAQDRGRRRALVNAVMNFRIPENSGNFLASCKPVSVPRRTAAGVSK
jgi:hypothetical protein